MKSVPKVDMQGYYYEDIIADENFRGVVNHASTNINPAVMGYVVGYPLPEGLFKPRLDVERLKKEYKSDDALNWPDGSDAELAMSFWIEGLTQEEIAGITKPNPPSEIDVIRQEVANQNSAIWEYLLFGGV